MRVFLGLAHQHAAAEIRADVAIGEVHVMQVGALGEAEQAGVRLGFPQVAMVVEVPDVVAAAVELAPEGVVLIAEGERPQLGDDLVDLSLAVGNGCEIDVGFERDRLALEAHVVSVHHAARLLDELDHLIDVVHQDGIDTAVEGQRPLRHCERADRQDEGAQHGSQDDASWTPGRRSTLACHCAQPAAAMRRRPRFNAGIVSNTARLPLHAAHHAGHPSASSTSSLFWFSLCTP